MEYVYLNCIIVLSVHKQLPFVVHNNSVRCLFCLLKVNYLQSHGLSDIELRLENVHISPVVRHIKVNAGFPPSYAVFLILDSLNLELNLIYIE